MDKLKARKALEKISPYQPAKTLRSVCEAYHLDSIIKLAGNENRLGCSENVAKALLERKEEIAFYPDTNYTDLREKLIRIHNVEAEELIFGNGSFELISLIAQAYLNEEDESVINTPSFGWYTNVTLQMGAIPVYVPTADYKVSLSGIQNVVTNKTKIIWICNPNNPTGTVLPAEELIQFINEIPSNILIVLDEAYIDFTEKSYIDTVELIKKYDNVILLRTFSKVYGLAAFRIGYGIANEKIISNLHKVRLPINVNFAAYLAAAVSLDDKAFKEKVLENNKKGLALYYKELDALGIKYVRSNGNFILIDIGLDGKYAEEEFLKRGIMIRNGDDFGLKNHVRISIGTEEENKKVIEIIKLLCSK